MLHETDELTRLKSAITAAAAHPIEEASTMPAATYTSQTLLDFERREIFAKEWICLGRVEEIPNPGDYFTIRAAEEPLIVIRADDGEIRVLTNVCRHKWTRLLDGAGNVNRIVWGIIYGSAERRQTPLRRAKFRLLLHLCRLLDNGPPSGGS